MIFSRSNLPDIPPFLMKLVERIAKIPGVCRVVLFGSRARGDNEPRSDIDLAVEMDRPDLPEWYEIEEIVEEAPTLLSIDLVRWDRASEELLANIRKDGITLYEKR
ncbi:MAG TPA: nucleotidyltransferase domain-containing protein [Chroococcales cyanobacterium]|jgi:predicted nucleotidyltransferase